MRQKIGRIPAKGTSRRVVIVPGEEDGLFEQIICVVRDDQASQRGVTAETILREAQDLLQIQELDEEERPRLFSGVVLILMLTALLLLTAILVYLYFHGWSG